MLHKVCDDCTDKVRRIRSSADWQGFALAALGAGEDEAQLARVVVELAHQAEAVRIAFQAFHVEASERALRWGLRRDGWSAKMIVVMPHAAQCARGGGTIVGEGG